MDPCMHILSTLASGTSGVVKKAKIKGHIYAVKIISKEKVSKMDVIKETKIMSSLQHPNIVRFFSFVENDSNFNIVMELAEIELFDLIINQQTMHVDLVHFYFKQLLNAVSYMHRAGYCHRDIKPENILLDSAGNLKLSDFGHSTCFRYKGSVRKMNSFVGTIKFMAPEIFDKSYDHKVDIWACGIVLLIMLTGRVAWEEARPSDPDFLTFFHRKFAQSHPLLDLKKEHFDLFMSMCVLDPKNRPDAIFLLQGTFLSKKSCLEDANGLCKDKNKLQEYLSKKTISNISFSQPLQSKNVFGKAHFLVSQPVMQEFDISMLKRVYIPNTLSVSEIVDGISAILDEMLISYVVERNIFSFSTVDQFNNPLGGEICIEKMKDCICVHFSRITGDCIQFNNFFSIASEKIQNHHF